MSGNSRTSWTVIARPPGRRSRRRGRVRRRVGGSPGPGSSQPTGGNCLEVADLPSGAAVRDSQNPAAGHLEVPSAEWSALLASVRFS
ncbi:DUF397 domain-containing protein [Nocardiopsis aegyptia]|uniref:DUF397 domain-containing protein n=1 Tax=Nocardiopsis aegyptia TaxID=220378 RepID=UPI0015CD8BC7